MSRIGAFLGGFFAVLVLAILITLATGILVRCIHFTAEAHALEPLAPGWNLVTGDGQNAEAFVEDNACVTAVWTWDNTTLPNGTGFWRGYFPGDGTYFENASTFGVIAQLEAGHAYWAYCEGSR